MDNNMVVTEEKQAKRNFMRIGIALSVMVVLFQGVGTVIIYLIREYAPFLLKDPYRSWISVSLSAVCIYLLAFPVMMLILRKVPTQKAKQKRKLGVKEFGKYLLIFMGATYLANYITVCIVLILSGLKGSMITNPLQSLQEGNMLANIIFVVILAPIMEEVIFRGYLLNKLRRYGDIPAIIVTALGFGLFHGNISQVLYAVVGGLIFGYIAVRTGTIKYTVIIHMIMNTFGMVVSTFVVKQQNILFTMSLGMLVLLFIVAGTLLFVFNFKKIRLEKGSVDIPTNTLTKYMLLNPGMICYYVVSLALIVFLIVKQ